MRALGVVRSTKLHARWMGHPPRVGDLPDGRHASPVRVPRGAGDQRHVRSTLGSRGEDGGATAPDQCCSCRSGGCASARADPSLGVGRAYCARRARGTMIRRGSPQAGEDPAVTLRRLRQRLYVIEPVFRAALALYRKGGKQTQEDLDRVERAVARALDSEGRIAEGWSISDLDLDREVPR